MIVHRTLDGNWAECADPQCELKFHIPDATPDELAAAPLVELLPLFELVDPPTRDVVFNAKVWKRQMPDFMEIHRDYDLPAIIHGDGTMQWWHQNRLHRAHGRPAIIHPDGEVEYWEHGKRARVQGDDE